MPKHRKIFVTLISLAAIFLCVLIVLLIVTPQMINLDAVKEEVKSLYAKELGGDIEYQRLNLAFFPRPHVVLADVRFTIPDNIDGTVDSVKVYPKILPLFTGKLEIGAFHSRSPEVRIRFPESSTDAPRLSTPFSLETPGDRLKKIMQSIPEFRIPSISITVSNGRVNFFKGAKRVLGLQGVSSEVKHRNATVDFSAQCQSNFWDNISIKGQYTEPGFKLNSQIKLNQLRPHAVIEYFSPGSGLKMTNAQANLELDLETDGPNHLQAAFQGTIPYMYWRRGNKDLKINDARFQGGFQFDDERLMLDVVRLDLTEPRLRLAGRLDIDPRQSRIQLELEGTQINVTTTQKIALAMTENDPTVSEIFTILRDGDFQRIAFKSKAADWAQLADENNFVIQGNLIGGKIAVPTGGLHLENVKGDATIENGILKGENVEAQMGNSFGKNGKLAISLTKDSAPFHVEGLIQADLSQLPAVLANLIKDDTFKKELRLLEKFEGSAIGMLVIGEDSRDVNVRVMASDFNVNAVYQRFLYPLTVKGGSFVLDGSQIALANCDVRMGKTSLSRLSTRFGWHKSSSLEISSATAFVDLAQLHAWLRQNRTFENDLEKIEAIDGTVSLQNLNLNGPLYKPGQWRLKTTGDVQNLSLRSSLLPGPVMVGHGRFNCENNQLKIKQLNAYVGQSSFSDLSAQLKWGKAASLTASAAASTINLDEVYAWLRSHATLKKHVADIPALKGSLAFNHLAFEGPLSATLDQRSNLSGDIAKWSIFSSKLPTDLELTGGRLVWRGTRIDLQKTNATFRTSTIYQLSLGGQWGQKPFWEVDADSATIQVGDLYAWLNQLGKNDQMFKGFAATQGQMTLSTLNFKGPLGVSESWQFHLTGDIKDLMLEASHFKAPIHIKTANFDAKDTRSPAGLNGRIDLNALQIDWEESRMVLEGHANFSKNELTLDMRLTADQVNWGQVEQLSDTETTQAPEEKMALLGNLKFESDSFTYDDYTWRPVHADITFNKTDTRIVIRKADLCGIHFPGILKVSADTFEFYFNPVAQDKDLKPSIECLSDKQNLADGRFNLDGELLAKARPSAFPKSLTGNLEFKADQGRIYRFGMLAKVFALLNVTEIYRGEVPELTGKGFAYNSMTANGVFEDGKLIIKDTTIDSPSMGIAIEGDIDLIKKKVNLIVLVAPFKTVDRIVKHIPLVGNILGGSLISIPFRATGDLGNPDVIPLSPTAVGSGLLGILERTLKLPITIIQPVLPGSKDPPGAEEKKPPRATP